MDWLLTTTALLCTVAILHSYLFYPWYVMGRARTRVQKTSAGGRAVWPDVHVLMAVHNEERVLAEKLASLAEQDYRGLMHLSITSDCSTDRSDALLRQFELAGNNRRYTHQRNDLRKGKPATINTLARRAGAGGIYVLTDASVMLQADTVTELVRPLLARPELGVVDSRMVHTGVGVDGVGASEDLYINREVQLKQAEGELYEYFMGPFGGCWAIRAAAFEPVPDSFLVDDFFLCLNAYRKGWRGISSDKARVYEAVGQRMSEEFRRKVRIGSGNWQNLVHFWELWWPPWKDELAFVFFSHKILRWLTPLLSLLLAGCLLGLWLLGGNYWAGLLLLNAIGLLVLTALADFVLDRLGFSVRPLRNLNYFIVMNAALVVGFLRFLNGINSNVWQPSHRPRPPEDSGQ